MNHRHKRYSDVNRFSKLIIDVVSAVLDGNGDAALTPRDYRDRFTGIAAERKQKRVQLLVISDDALNDIFLPNLRIGQIHRYTSFRFLS